jgi:hypothetical protein
VVKRAWRSPQQIGFVWRFLYGRAGCLTAQNGGFRPRRAVWEPRRCAGALHRRRHARPRDRGGQVGRRRREGGALLLALPAGAVVASPPRDGRVTAATG